MIINDTVTCEDDQHHRHHHHHHHHHQDECHDWRTLFKCNNAAVGEQYTKPGGQIKATNEQTGDSTLAGRIDVSMSISVESTLTVTNTTTVTDTEGTTYSLTGGG